MPQRAAANTAAQMAGFESKLLEVERHAGTAEVRPGLQKGVPSMLYKWHICLHANGGAEKRTGLVPSILFKWHTCLHANGSE